MSLADPAAKAQILVVDDDANLRELAALHLTEAGYSVRVAKDGVAAGYAVLELPPDLIICDMQMPRMTGVEFVTALRADNTLPRMPVVFLSSFDEGADYSRLGVAETLSKPVGVEDLLAAVRKHLSRGEASSR